MSQKKIKEARKESAAEWEVRRTAYLKEIVALSEKYRIDIIPRLVTTQTGETSSLVSAKMELLDMTSHYEHKETNA